MSTTFDLREDGNSLREPKVVITNITEKNNKGLAPRINGVFCLPKLKTTFMIVLNGEEHIQKCIEIAEN